MENFKVYKILSRNDTGETNSHQSGMSVPKEIARSGIFPMLGTESLNPRTEVDFYDEQNIKWTFQYIYYNDAFFGKERGKGHDEYRLTCIKEFLRSNNVKSGDSIWFFIDNNGIRHVGIKKQEEELSLDNTETKITIGSNSSWVFVKIK